MKKLLVMVMVLSLVLSLGSFAFADNNGPEVYNITVGAKGGTYEFGNITVSFKNGYLETPVSFEIKLYAENGTPYIEFNPNVDAFAKDVQIKVKAADKSYYDVATGQMVNVHFTNYNFKVGHFSRYITVN